MSEYIYIYIYSNRNLFNQQIIRIVTKNHLWSLFKSKLQLAYEVSSWKGNMHIWYCLLPRNNCSRMHICCTEYVQCVTNNNLNTHSILFPRALVLRLIIPWNILTIMFIYVVVVVKREQLLARCANGFQAQHCFRIHRNKWRPDICNQSGFYWTPGLTTLSIYGGQF